jgi:hypothetical protein
MNLKIIFHLTLIILTIYLPSASEAQELGSKKSTNASSHINIKNEIASLSHPERMKAYDILRSLSDNEVYEIMSLNAPLVYTIEGKKYFLGTELKEEKATNSCIPKAVNLNHFHPGHYLSIDSDYDLKNTYIHMVQFEGIRKAYKWRDLELEKNIYYIHDINQDLSFVKNLNKQLFIEIDLIERHNLNNPPTPNYIKQSKAYGGDIPGMYGNFALHPSIGLLHPLLSNSSVKDALKEMISFLAENYNTDPNFEGISIGMTGIDFQFSGISCQEYLETLLDILNHAKDSFYNKTVLLNIDFICQDIDAFVSKLEENYIGIETPFDLDRLQKPFVKEHTFPKMSILRDKIPTASKMQTGNSPSDELTKTLLKLSTKEINPWYHFWHYPSNYNSFSIENAVMSSHNGLYQNQLRCLRLPLTVR